MGIFGCLSSTTSFILLCVTIGQLAKTQTRFKSKMDELNGNYTELITVEHDDFRGVVYLLHTPDYNGTAEQKEKYDKDISGSKNYLSLQYLQNGETTTPGSFSKHRPTFFGFAAFNCVFYSFIYIMVATLPSNEQIMPAKIMYKLMNVISQYQIMMIYLCAEKEPGELILFYVPGDAIVIQFIMQFGGLCLAGCCFAVDKEAGNGFFGLVMCTIFFIINVGMYAITFDYIPNFVETMNSESYQDYVIFDDEFYDKQWLAFELLGSSFILDTVSFVVDPCCDSLCGIGGLGKATAV